MTRPCRFLAAMAVTALFAPLLAPVPASAQVRLLPQAGLYAPVSDLGTVSTTDGARSVGERESSFAYGAALELGEPDGTTFRVTGLYGSDAEVPVGGVGCSGVSCRMRSTVVSVTGSLVLRPLPRIILVQPYLVAGGGLKRYDYDFDGDASLRDALGDDANKATAKVGVGADWTLGIANGTVELTDYVSPSVLDDGGDTQHDFFLTVGLYIG